MGDSGISLGETSESSNESAVQCIITEDMIAEERLLEEKAIAEENEAKNRLLQEKEKRELEEQCYKRLHLLLSRSSIYAKFMADKLKRDNLKEIKKKSNPEKQKNNLEQKNRPLKRKNDASASSSKKKNTLTVVDAFRIENMHNKKHNEKDTSSNSITSNETESVITQQPKLLTGAIMHPYQIEGFEWLKVLFENGVNGILADEMGLGKTIQCIAFISYLIQMGISGPFFVCGPLSTVPNWYAEFKRFAPTVPVIVYHGHKSSRLGLLKNINKRTKEGNVCCCPVVITSYQIALIDAKFLSKFEWKLLVIDEAHRIKNFQCRLVSALKTFRASHRLLMTGTPLQNNLSELWSLLNFILPEIFDDLQVFESWFDVSVLAEKGCTEDIVAKEQEKQIVSIIHEILTPFLLRRTKAEVQLKLPPKKEVIVHAPLTKLQRDYYTAVLNKTIERFLKVDKGQYIQDEVVDDVNSDRPKRKVTPKVDLKKLYKMYEDDSLEDPEVNEENELTEIPVKQNSENISELKEIFSCVTLNMRNVTMLLRKISNHPYLVSYPLTAAGEYKIDEDLIKNSGKLLVLDALLPELKKRGHKILLFSQFVVMLHMLEDYCMYRNYKYNMIYGQMSLDERSEEIKSFNSSKDSFLFLISTKAGGLGINLAEADTVIIYDSDWNPQGDLQAQDRCHRIGQTKPVLVYRLIVPNTIDEKILNRAITKRKLEKVIIKKGRFNSKDKSKEHKLSPEELLELLQSSDCDGFVKTDDNCVLSESELQRILDRSDMMIES